MRTFLLGRLPLLILGGLAGALTMSLSLGQNTAPPQALPAHLPAVDVNSPPAAAPSLQPVLGVGNPTQRPQQVAPAAAQPKKVAAFDRFRNLKALSDDLTRQMVMATQMSMEWLYRYNQPNGKFLCGYLPAVNTPMEDDRYLQQALATFALCRAGRFTGDEGYLVRGNQSILTLLSGTAVDPAAAGVRRTVQPSLICNRLGAAGYLVMSISELPDPAADLLIKSEELCSFIRLQQRPDGSLNFLDGSGDDAQNSDPDGVNRYPGPALYAITLSQRHRPAAWKTEMLRQALAHYRKWFKEHPNPEFVPWMTAAAVEMHLKTKEAGFAEFALEMNDWLRTLQYEQPPDPRKPYWRGGFKSAAGGKIESSAPGLETAAYAQSLADCCRMLRQMQAPDVQRYELYRSSLLRALQFLSTLQFSESTTQHIAPNYRMMLLGGFHPSWTDGNLRVDQNACCVSAFIQFLASGADQAQ